MADFRQGSGPRTHHPRHRTLAFQRRWQVADTGPRLEPWLRRQDRNGRDSPRALLVSAALASTSGVLAAATTPSEGSSLVLLPLLALPVGVIIAGHLFRRDFLAWLGLLPVLFIGWYGSFVLSYGLFPAGLFVAAGVAAVTMVYPFDRGATRVLLLAALAAAVLSCATLVSWVVTTGSGSALPVAFASAAVSAFVVACVVRMRTAPLSRGVE